MSQAEAMVGSRSTADAGTPRRYRLHDQVVLAGPYPTYTRMRAADPLYRERRFGWVLTRYDDVAWALRAPQLSAHRPLPDEPVPEPLRAIADEVRALRRFQSLWMLYADPPQHRRLRALVGAAFTPRVVEGMRGRIQQIVDGLIDAVEPTGQMDMIANLAYPLPTTVIADLLGLPVEDRTRFKQWSDDIAAGFFVIVTRQTATAVTTAYQSQNALADYFRELVAERRAHPRDDLLSALAAAESDGGMLSQDELLATCVLLLFAGHETTTNLIGNGCLALLEHPEQLERLRQEPTLVASAVEEFLRYDGPVQATARRATVGFELHGTQINPNDYLLLVLGSAHRDPAQFREPDRLDLSRADNRHLAFSLGPHFCLGAALARPEAQIAFETLLRRLPRLRPGPTPPVRRPDFFLRGLASLPVAFDGRETTDSARG